MGRYDYLLQENEDEQEEKEKVVTGRYDYLLKEEQDKQQETVELETGDNRGFLGRMKDKASTTIKNLFTPDEEEQIDQVLSQALDDNQRDFLEQNKEQFQTTDSGFKDPINAQLLEALENKCSKLRKENSVEEPRPEKLSELQDEILEIEGALVDKSPSRIVIADKYARRRTTDQIKGTVVQSLKSIFDGVASIFEVDVAKQEEFAQSQEVLIQDAIKAMEADTGTKLSDEQKAEYIKKYSPRHEKSPLKNNGRSLEEMRADAKKAQEAGREPFQKTMERYVDDMSPDNPDFGDQIIAGVGSMATYYTIAVATGGGAVIPGLLEAVSEAGTIYEENKKKGLNPIEAFEESSKGFIANVVWNVVLNKFSGIFDDAGEVVTKSAKKKVIDTVRGSTFEGIQEAGQTAISNSTTGKEDIWEGALESFGVGAIVGGAVPLVSPTTAPTDTVTDTQVTEESNNNNQNDSSGSSDLIEGDGVRTTQNVKRETITKDAIPDLPQNTKQASISIRPDGTASFNIEINEDAQGQGNGAKAVNAMEKVILSKNVKDVVLPVKSEKQGFFEKQGYTFVKELDNGLVEMTKELNVGDLQTQTRNATTEGKLIQEVEDIINSEFTQEKVDRLFEIRDALPESQKAQVDVGIRLAESQGYARTLPAQNAPESISETKTPKVSSEQKQEPKTQKKVTKSTAKPETTPNDSKQQVTPTKPDQPVGQGRKKQSKFAKRVSEQLLASNPEGYEFDETTSTYNTLNLEEDARKATEFLENNPAEAIAVSLGTIKPPAGQTANGIAIATILKARQENNFQLYAELLSSTSLRNTRLGQEIVSLRGHFNNDSPENYVKRLIKQKYKTLGNRLISKSERAGRALGKRPNYEQAVVERIDAEKAELKKELRKRKRKVSLAQDIIDAMRC